MEKKESSSCNANITFSAGLISSWESENRLDIKWVWGLQSSTPPNKSYPLVFNFCHRREFKLNLTFLLKMTIMEKRLRNPAVA